MPRTPRPARQSSQERQASLIQAAATLFAKKGFNGTTTKEIARAAGVSEALVFKHFPTKRALYAAILAEKVTVGALLEAIAKGTGGEVVSARQLTDFAKSLPNRKAPITESWTSPLWHQTGVFLFALACFVAEWGLRRKRGLA